MQSKVGPTARHGTALHGTARNGQVGRTARLFQQAQKQQTTLRQHGFATPLLLFRDRLVSHIPPVRGGKPFRIVEARAAVETTPSLRAPPPSPSLAGKQASTPKLDKQGFLPICNFTPTPLASDGAHNDPRGVDGASGGVAEGDAAEADGGEYKASPLSAVWQAWRCIL